MSKSARRIMRKSAIERGPIRWEYYNPRCPEGMYRFRGFA